MEKNWEDTPSATFINWCRERTQIHFGHSKTKLNKGVFNKKFSEA